MTHIFLLIFITTAFLVIIASNNFDATTLTNALDAKFKIEDVTRPSNENNQWIELLGQVASESGNIYFVTRLTMYNNFTIKYHLGKIDNISKKQLFITPPCFDNNDIISNLFVTGKEEIYVLTSNSQIFTVDWESNTCTLIAGSGGFGYSGDGGLATNATFSRPCCIHVENNMVYIADSGNHVVRVVKDGIIYTLVKFPFPVIGLYRRAPDSDFYFAAHNLVYRRSNLTREFSIIAGNYTLGGGFSGDGGPATNAQLYFRGAVGFLVVDNQLFITDSGNHRVRVVDLNTGIINSFAGKDAGVNPVYSVYGNGDGGPALDARLIELNPSLSYWNGYIYTFDSSLIAIRRINLKTNIISSIIGQSYNSMIVGPFEDGFRAIDVYLQNPKGLALDSYDNLLVSDPSMGNLYNITKDGLLNMKFPKQMKYFSDVYQPFLQKIASISVDENIVSVVSESGYIQKLDSDMNSQMIGGPLTSSRFTLDRLEDIVLSSPKGLYSYNGTVFISDSGHHRIIKVDRNTGKAKLIAGNGVKGFNFEKLAVNSQLNSPTGLFVSGDYLFFADTMNHMIRNINLVSGDISTIAGTGRLGFSGDNSNAILAELNSPTYVIEYRNDIYFSDTNNNRLRMINGTTNIITTIAGTGIQGFNSDGEALKTHLANPRGLVMIEHYLFFIDTGNQRIRYLDFSSNQVITLAGGDSDSSQQSIIGLQQASFNFPSHLSLQPCDQLYSCTMFLTDTQNYRIRIISGTSTIDTLVGTGIKGNTFISDTQLGLNVNLNRPECTFFDPISQVLYISDTENNRVLIAELSIYASNNPSVKLFLGSVGYGKVEQAEIYASTVSSKNGYLYVTESIQNRIRKISPDGTISNIGGNGIFGISQDGSQANISSLASPKGIFVNQEDEVIFTELGTSKIRKITRFGELETLAGDGSTGFSGDEKDALFSNLNSPSYVGASKTDLFITDTQNFRIRRVGLSDGIISTIAGNGKSLRYYTSSLELASNQSISPGSLVVTSENTVFFIDHQQYNIKKLTPYCDEGYNLYQFRSCLPLCYGKIGQIDPTVCSGRGQCLSPNSCSCDKTSGYGGNECQIPICYNILGNNPQVCSSNGTCIDSNTCQCNSGFTGGMCQIPICFGKVNEDSCGGITRGNCITKDTCSCNSGFTGNQCELFTCQGISQKDTNVCSGSGQCINPNFCSCNFGYSGDNCEEKTNLLITIGVSSGVLLLIVIVSIVAIISFSILFKKYKRQKKMLGMDEFMGQKLLSFSENSTSYGINYTEESLFISIEKLSLDTSIRKIGSGTSNVYQTIWNGQSVAVKVYDMNNLDVGEEEFISEARILASLRHPNIVTFYGFSNSQTKRYIVMELMESNLQQLISNLQKRVEFKSMNEKIDILIKIASGIEYLHTLPKKIIHRDLKPANILYQNGKCKLCDFGLSKAMDNQNTLITNNIGTLYYCPPEVANVIKYETVAAIDIYSFAIIMWQVLFEISDPYNYVGKLVLEKLNLLDEVVYPSLFHLHKQICDNQKRPTIPFDSLETCQKWSRKFADIQQAEMIFNLCELIKKCWSQSPANRPSIEEVLNELHILHSISDNL